MSKKEVKKKGILVEGIFQKIVSKGLWFEASLGK
jgi:hypothetical protein